MKGALTKSAKTALILGRKNAKPDMNPKSRSGPKNKTAPRLPTPAEAVMYVAITKNINAPATRSLMY
jgi:hypothetical protein